MTDLTHVDKSGKIKMVDISGKSVSERIATARSTLFLPKEVAEKFIEGDFQTKKGPVIQTAVIAGIMASKKTSELIPLCHSLQLNYCAIDIKINNNEMTIECSVSTEAKTGVEMEALTGATFAALTVYDMCKALSHDIIIKETMLMKKSGGKNDFERK